MKALILSGGGARGAYQVGVLKALGEIAAEIGKEDAFQIMTGVSAGAINAAHLASEPTNLLQKTTELANLWSQLSFDQVFRIDAKTMSSMTFGWFRDLSSGRGLGHSSTAALLDTSPLRDLIDRTIHPDGIAKALAEKKLKAFAVTALDYRSSTAVTFVQGDPLLADWTRSRRRSMKATITTDHIMASSAIPILFPAIKVGSSYYGDGCVRNITPLSAAIHLGATQLFVIGVRRLSKTADDMRALESESPPSFARLANVLLNAVLLDGIETDMERLNRVNDFIRKVPKSAEDRLSFDPIESVWVHPRGDIGALAATLSQRLPRAIRYALKALGPLDDASEIISYLLFEAEFCQKLIAMGYEDGRAQEQAIVDFLKS